MRGGRERERSDSQGQDTGGGVTQCECFHRVSSPSHCVRHREVTAGSTC